MQAKTQQYATKIKTQEIFSLQHALQTCVPGAMICAKNDVALNFPWQLSSTLLSTIVLSSFFRSL